jgi:MFS family permease
VVTTEEIETQSKRRPHDGDATHPDSTQTSIQARGKRRFQRRGLWLHRDFVNLWAAESVAQFGAQITLLALPLAAALTLDASASQMGILTAAGTAPALLLGLFAGVLVDRLRRKPLLVAADLGRALLLTMIPVLWFFDALRIEALYAIGFGTGILTVFFDVAYQSFLPTVVSREQIIEGNSKLQASASVAQVAGPGMAGVLVGLVGAPLAIVANAASYLGSALFIGRIRVTEPSPEASQRRSVWHEAVEGLRVVFGHAILRPMALCAAISSLFGYVFLAVYILYMLNTLDFSPAQVGLVLGLGGVGALIGALIAEPLARGIGVGPSIIAGRLLFGAGGLVIPLAVTVPALEVPLVVGAEFFQWLVLIVAIVNELSLRQTITPDRLQGRVHATMRVMNAGMVPIGALAGGLLGDAIGLRATLVVGVAGMFVAFIFVLLSPLRTLRRAPAIHE